MTSRTSILMLSESFSTSVRATRLRRRLATHVRFPLAVLSFLSPFVPHPHALAVDSRLGNHPGSALHSHTLCKHIPLWVSDHQYPRQHVLLDNHVRDGLAGAIDQKVRSKNGKGKAYCVTYLTNVALRRLAPFWTVIDKVLK